VTSVHQPAEWEPHEACWLAWPSHGELWLDQLQPAQAELTALARAIADPDPAGRPRGERLEVLVPDEAAGAAARTALDGLGARFHPIPFGDIWLRDTAPIFVRSGAGQVLAARFAFNGWGGKYVLDHDDQVAARISAASGLPSECHGLVLEGGSVEVDGEGTLLTTRQCLLNPNRNPSLDQAAIERALATALGAERTLWLGDGLLNDHTDGHIDTIARFVAPGRVAAMIGSDASDPNREVMATIASDLAAMTDARGRRLEVVTIPSPGKVCAADGRVMPASYLNFYIGNTTVVVPTYGSAQDQQAVRAIAACFPGRRTVGCSAKAILSGGGAFHCITQQQPRGGAR
jgi:agmatine deiminase